MLQNKVFKAVSVATVLLVTAFLLAAQSGAKASDQDLVGKWKMTSFSPDGDPIPWSLNIKEADGKLVATLDTENQGEVPANGFTATGAKVHLKAPYEGEDYDIDLTLVDGKLTGTWSGNGDSGKTIGERAAAER
jgi:uncharacterized protein (TIGR03066 family)